MACLLLALWLAAQAPAGTLSLEIRVFAGAEDVTAETRVAIHRAGDRGAAIAQTQPSVANGRHVFTVPEGIYDAQLVRERDGRVLNIRWAERLVVMPYPDEGGKHLEVVNFTNGYGALQVRSPRPGPLPEVALYAAGERTRPAAPPAVRSDIDGYVLFVVPPARYDVQVSAGGRQSWHPDIEIPLDRTRLWLIPQ
jgi:hypothetical protein